MREKCKEVRETKVEKLVLMGEIVAKDNFSALNKRKRILLKV